MPSRAIEEFARKLVTAVRDRTIQSCDAILRPTAQNVIAKRWREAGAGKEQEVTVPDAVDEALFFLLNAIEPRWSREPIGEDRHAALEDRGVDELELRRRRLREQQVIAGARPDE